MGSTLCVLPSPQQQTQTNSNRRRALCVVRTSNATIMILSRTTTTTSDFQNKKADMPQAQTKYTESPQVEYMQPGTTRRVEAASYQSRS